MVINTEQMIPMADAERDFSKAARIVDKAGIAVIQTDNQPRYVVMTFAEYERLDSAAMQMRREKIMETADAILNENMEAFLELAK